MRKSIVRVDDILPLELPVLPKGGAKFKALVTGSLGSLETFMFSGARNDRMTLFLPQNSSRNKND